MLICFDIDGTLANLDHRIHLVRSKPKNWPAFFAGVKHDLIIPEVVSVYQHFAQAGHDIILASGRGEESRPDTEAWLAKSGLTDHKRVYMRAAKDYRSDVIVKQEILYNQIIPDFGKKPDMVFDDRPGVVQMWRDNGIFVFNVYQGTEDF